MRSVFITMAVLMSVLLSVGQSTSVQINPKDFNERLMQKAIHAEVNKYRVSMGKKELVHNFIIAEVAAVQNDYIKDQKELSHDQPSPDKATLKDRFINRTKVTSDYAIAENIARTFILTPTYNFQSNGKQKLSTANTYQEAAEYMVNAWKASELHNKNMLVDEFRITGISVHFNKSNLSLTATQVFARIGNG